MCYLTDRGLRPGLGALLGQEVGVASAARADADVFSEAICDAQLTTPLRPRGTRRVESPFLTLPRWETVQ